ncbi:MAG: putative cytosine-specific methyltransferase, partial [Prokaryotic dsDNA virus sp.]
MKLLDLFSGVGGFHLGLKQAGFKFDWVGFSEIDKYASKQYKKRFPNAKELGDITNVRCKDLPEDIGILSGGFPCQAFSIAGKRKGFDDTRGTLFFEIARILRYFKGIEKPIPYFILENVKGLLNHEDGQTFATIYRVLADLDYTIECQLLNTRWFLPQNRERIYIVGHFRGESRPKVFPIGESCSATGSKFEEGDAISCIDASYYKGVDGKRTMIQEGLKQIGTIGEDSEATRVYDPSGCARTIKNGGGMGAKTGLTGLYQVKPELAPERAEIRQYGQKQLDETLQQNDLKEDDVKALDLYNRKAQDYCPPLVDANHMPRLYEKTKIRRLTPTECERLQGFPDGWTEGQSDTQRYRQLGN